jgi:hypothetical protein
MVSQGNRSTASGTISPLEACVLTQLFRLREHYLKMDLPERQKDPTRFVEYHDLLSKHDASRNTLQMVRRLRDDAFAPMSDAEFREYARTHSKRYARS